MKKVKLTSGAELSIALAPFADSKALYQACLEEMKSLNFDGTKELDHNFFKDIFCTGLSSKKVEQALTTCMSRCLYDGLKISDETFEPEKARGDYFDVIIEVAKENIMPFTKNLYAKFSPLVEMLVKSQ